MEKLVIRLTLTPRQAQMIQELKERYGSSTDQDAMRQCLAFAHAKAFPSYVAAENTRQNRKPLTAEDRLKRKQEDEQAKINFARQEYLEILSELGGEHTIKDGHDYATYYTYSHSKRYPQTVPLRMVSRDIIKTQYFPSRERVEKYQKEGKCDYPVDNII